MKKLILLTMILTYSVFAAENFPLSELKDVSIKWTTPVLHDLEGQNIPYATIKFESKDNWTNNIIAKVFYNKHKQQIAFCRRIPVTEEIFNSAPGKISLLFTNCDNGEGNFFIPAFLFVFDVNEFSEALNKIRYGEKLENLTGKYIEYVGNRNRVEGIHPSLRTLQNPNQAKDQRLLSLPRGYCPHSLFPLLSHRQAACP